MIEVSNLTKRFGSKIAVDNLSFQVKPGVVTGFLGPNGSGKSTTMRMILGLDTPTHGEARIDGKPFRQHAHPSRMVGALLDASWAHPRRSARAHLLALAAYANLPSSRATEVLDLVGLQDVGRKKVGGFSLGMRQRLGLAAAMLGDPPVLMFDEPVNGLDPEGIVWVRNFMKARAKEGRTVLVSSHLLAEMALTADELVVIGRGKLRAQETVANILASQRATVVVRTPYPREFSEALAAASFTVDRGQDDAELHVHTDQVERVGEVAAETGVVLHELRLARPTLEEAFMSLTSDDVEYRTGAAHGGAPAGQSGLQPGQFPGQPAGQYAPQSAQQFPNQYAPQFGNAYSHPQNFGNGPSLNKGQLGGPQ